MEGVLPGIWSLSPLAALVGVIVLSYWLLATGRLITKGSHERELAQANKRGDDWRDTSGTKDTIIAEQAGQITKLIDANQINQQVFLAGIGKTQPTGGA